MAFLAIESATDVCSVAIVRQSETLFDRTVEAPRRHAELLAPMIRDAMAVIDESNGVSLAGVCASAGPGSYTGLRIGVSSAKGVCVARDVPLLAVPTLHTFVVANDRSTSPGTTLAVLFARADEWYGCILQHGGDDGDNLTETLASRVATIDEWLALVAELDSNVTVVTTAQSRARLETRRKDLEERGIHIELAQPSAVTVGRVGQRMAAAGTFADIDTFEPAYLRPFVARTAKGSIFDRLSF